jgi:hypothetical protein
MYGTVLLEVPMQVPVPPPQIPAPPAGFFFVTEVLPVAIIAVAAVTGLWLVLRAWSRSRDALPPGEIGQLTTSLESVRESQEMILHTLEDLRNELTTHANDLREISGRVEFTERMLSQGRPRELDG